MTITKAHEARRNKHLDTLVNTESYGVVTRREFITRRLSEGGRIAAVNVNDDNLRAKLQHEYDVLNRGFNVPWGNNRHPTTIKAQALKDRLAGRITSVEYRLYEANDTGVFYALSKTAYDFANGLIQGGTNDDQ